MTAGSVSATPASSVCDCVAEDQSTKTTKKDAASRVVLVRSQGFLDAVTIAIAAASNAQPGDAKFNALKIRLEQLEQNIGSLAEHAGLDSKWPPHHFLRILGSPITDEVTLNSDVPPSPHYF